MDYNKWIADLEPGDEIEGFYILKTAQIKTCLLYTSPSPRDM